MAKTTYPAMKILDRHKKLVWPEIKKYLKDPIFPRTFGIPKEYQKASQTYWEIVKEYPKRQGKYLRPTLLLLVAKAMDQNPEKALKTAAAMQLSQDWLLIHDDLQDKSIIRRGKPTLHKMYNPEIALNAGDTLQIIMWKMLVDNESILGFKKTLELMNEFYVMLKRTADGQAIEIMWAEGKRTDFADKDWFFVADGKTSYYTIAGPMRLGAIIANTNTKQLDSLSEFGKYLGRSFQLVDDVLDLTMQYKGIGQLMGNDIYESKRTIPLSHLIRTANLRDKKTILSIISRPRDEKSKDEVEWVIKKMNKYGSIQYSKRLAAKLKEKAYVIFEKELTFLSRQPARNHLESLIHFVLERKY